MNAKPELENRRLEPSNNSSSTMDSAAEVLQSLGDNQQAESGGAAKEEAPAKEAKPAVKKASPKKEAEEAEAKPAAKKAPAKKPAAKK